jgi:hypothetical protein
VRVIGSHPEYGREQMKNAIRPAVLALLALAAQSCDSDGAGGDADASTDADTDSDSDTGCVTGTYDGVDLLIMMDNSGGMGGVQALLAEGMLSIADALLNGETAYDAIDAMRVAVVTSNMGVSYGEDRDIPDDGDVPPSLLQVSAHCEGNGDDGDFQPIQVASFEIDGGTIDCAGLAGSYAETSAEAPNADFAVKTACLTQQGTAGCGWEQQLQSAAVALGREDQQWFLVPSHVLAVLIVTDEEDCSMLDAPGLFATDEFQDATRLNIACWADSDQESYLFTPEYFYERYTSAKGEADAVVFAAITGVPSAEEDPEGAAACEGRGDAIGGCLDQEGMQRVPYENNSSGSAIWLFEPACTRTDVMIAEPGVRYVELASGLFGAQGYVSSICNPDWTPAMTDIAELIGERIEEACQ